VALFLEHEVTEALGARIGFVYKDFHNQIDTYLPNRPISAYTVPFTYLDTGPDGVARELTLYGIPRSQLTAFPNNQVLMNIPGYEGRYKTVEASFNKRAGRQVSLTGGYAFTWLHDDTDYGYPNTPNSPPLSDATRWSFKASGTYEAPWRIRINPVLRHQAGPNFARTISPIASASCACFFSAGYSGSASNLSSNVVLVEPYNTRRQDNVTLLDVRVEKSLGLGAQTKLSVFVDAFNLFNQYAAETVTKATGPNFLRPSAILAPRTMRLGFRFVW
jgi:hypothetical protein